MMKKRKEVVPAILIILLIIFSQNTMAFSSLQVGVKAALRDIVQIAVFFCLCISIVKKGAIKQPLLFAYLTFAGSIALSMMFHRDFAGVYCVLECTIGYMIVERYDAISLAEKFEKIMFGICVFYSVIHVLILLKKNIIYSSFFTWLYKFELLHDYRDVYGQYDITLRSYGPFREPGVYQMFIILALLIVIYVYKEMKYTHLLLYLIAIWMTHSTTGYICVVLCLVPSILRIIGKMDRSVLIVVGIVGVIICLPILCVMAQEVLEKITASGASSHSWLSRKASIVTNIYLWKQNPIFGVGMGTVFRDFARITKDVFGYEAGAYAITDDTNTILLFFAAYGLIPGVTFVAGLIKFCSKLSSHMWEASILVLMFVCLYAGEALNSTVYPYILCFIGFSSKKLLEQRERSNVINNNSLL